MNQEAERRFFINCLKCFLHGVSAEPPEETVSWEDVFQIAEKQDLVSIIYYQCKDQLPAEMKKKYLRRYVSYAAAHTMRQEALKELASCAGRERIPLLCMKGIVLQELYPHPALRSMGDIDLIVKEEYKEKLDQILRQELGYQRFIDNHAVWTYWKGSLFFEIHSHMFYENLANEVDYRTYFDTVWEHQQKANIPGIASELLFMPDRDFHFLYLITHTAKHITNKGSGFRPFLDMALYVQRYGKKMDWIGIRRELEKLKLLRFTQVCFALCSVWFEIEMPLQTKELDKNFVAAARCKVFDDGLFGLDNPQNEAANTAKEIKRSHDARWITAIRLTVRRLFPAYEDMQLIPWYSFVDGRPYLLPAAWIYRWVYCIWNKRRAGTDLLKEPFVKGDMVAARETWLRQWGL